LDPDAVWDGIWVSGGMGAVEGVQVPQAEGAVLDWHPHSPH